MLHPIQAVFFDFDGTLVDSEPLHYDCWMLAVRPFGGGMDWPEYNARFTGRTDFRAGQTLLREAGHDPTDATVREVLESKRRAFNSRFQQELSIEPDLIEWITQPSNILLLAVVSSSHRPEVEPLLDQEGILSRLAVTVCGDEVKRHKPHPEPYRLAYERLAKTNGQIQIENCLAIEDSEAGAGSAQAAGMKVRKVSAPSEVLAVLHQETGALHS